MPQPVSYNPGTPVSGSIQENSISYVVDGQNRNYRGGFGGLSWMSEVPAANNVIFIGNSVSLGRGPANIPLFYPSYNNSAANIIYAANTLPGSPRNFTTTGSAYDWATTNNFFINNSDNPIPKINADGLVLYVDANQPTSYPQTGTSWYDMSGRNNNGTLINGPTWNSNGWIVFDSTDDYTDTALATNTLFSSNDPFSVSITLKPTETINALSGLVCNQRYQSEDFPGGFGLVTYNTNQVAINLTKNDGTGTVSYQALAPTTLTINSWQNITYTYNPNTGTVIGYKNGTVDNSSTSTAYKWTPEARTTWIARNTQGGWGDFFSSEISNVSIYKKTLSTSEVKQNYFQSNIVQDGLVFMMDANNLVSYPKSGTLVYSLTGSLSGSLINGVGYNTGNGGSWVFDGTDDYIDFGPLPINSPLSFTNGNFTLEHWIKPTALQGGSYFGLANMILLKGPASTFNYATQVVDATSVRFYHRDINEGLSNNTFTVPNLLNVCTHLVFSINPAGTQITLYVNGLLQETQNLTGNPITPYANDGFLVGGFYTQQFTDFIGNIYTNRIYSKALTATEVQQNYQATKDKFLGQNIVTNGLVLNLDSANKDSYPGTGTTWYDLSGNGNNATVESNVSFNSSYGGGLTTLNNAINANQSIYGTFNLSSANYTWEIWYTNNGSQGGDASGFGVTDASGVSSNGFRANSNSSVQQWVGGSLTVGQTISTANTPKQVVLRRSGTTFNSFSNGVLIDTDTAASTSATFVNYSMNCSGCTASNNGWNGTYYIVRMYNRALSDAEILQNYNAQKIRFGL
jgi:hypothetical protein